MVMSGVLYVVATPIGNLEDITLRALRVLKSVDCIACEDTRHTRKLLSHYQIQKPLESYHEHNETAKSAQLTARLREGQSIALVTDAGTPTVSDPGYRLVRRCVEEGVSVIPIPGPVAAVATLSASGLPTDAFTFLGFPPPRATARRAWLEKAKRWPHTLLVYESPHRVAAFLQEAAEILGDRTALVARELTKSHETFYHGPLSTLARQFESMESVLGEVTVVINGNVGAEEAAEPIVFPESIADHLNAVIARTGLRRNDAIKVVARERRLSRREVYETLVRGQES